MSLYDFFGRRVRILDVDGVTWIGVALTYTPGTDSDDGTEWIGLDTANGGLIEFHPDDIANIEYMD